MRRGGQRRQVPCRRGWLCGLRDRRPHPWRHGLCQGVPCGAAAARGDDCADRARVARTHPVQYRGKGTGLAKVLLNRGDPALLRPLAFSVTIASVMIASVALADMTIALAFSTHRR